MNGRVIFTKDFLKKTEQPLTRKQLGELRMKKIIEAEKDGRLAQAKNRTEVAELVGIPKERISVANTWVHRKISLGYMTETLVKFDKNNRPEYEYHFYENKVAKPTAKKKKSTAIVKPVTKPIEPVVKPAEPVTPTQQVTIPVEKTALENGFSLTLNINFTVGK